MEKLILSIILGLALTSAFAQQSKFDRLAFLIGDWQGTGSGFGNNQSVITASYKPIMDGTYIEFVNESMFEPTVQNPEGEHHIDKGMISYDNARKAIVIRQYNSEGYFNQYLLNDSVSTADSLVFETEFIENFVPGGSATWTVEQISESEIETNFYVSFPGRKTACFGTNKLIKKTNTKTGGQH